MDPLTAALNAVTAALVLATKVWDATPSDAQRTGAADWAKFVHGVGDFFISVQAKINAAAK
jgi:hypothetical protein